MPQTFNFPSVLVSPGKTTLGPVTPDSGDNSGYIVIDRTIVHGLNSTPAGNNPWAFKFGVDISTDGGVTWITDNTTTCPGSDQQALVNEVNTLFPATGNRKVRAWFIVPAGITTLHIAGTIASGVDIEPP